VLTLILSFLLGAVLGMQFRVLVLFPLIGAVTLTVSLAGLVAGATLPASAIDVGLAISGVQLGYFAGMLMGSPSPRQANSGAKISRSAS